MKTAVKFMTILLMLGCGMDKDQMIKKQIQAKKGQISKLEDKIAELESQLSDTTDVYDRIKVETKDIVPEVFKHYITVFGNVEADQYAKVSPEMNGQIRAIHVREGQHVSKGALLVSLNTDATRSAIEEARTGLELANTNYERVKRLWDQGIGSEMQFLQAKNQKESAEARLSMLEAQVRMAEVRAPFDGIVDRIFLKEGDIAGPMSPLVEFVNLSRITIKADVSETFLGSINRGDEVEVSFSALNGSSRKANIARISKVINMTSRTFQVEINLTNPGELIRPNMISAIKINDYTSDDALVVPSIVIKRDITGDYLYVVSTDNKNNLVASKKYIKRGIAYDGITEISEGLNSGDKVIVAGYNLVSTGSYLALNK